jgi:hypothetical protein
MSDKKKRASKIIADGPPADMAVWTEAVPFGHYGWIMPRILDTMGLNVFEYRLIGHVKTVLAAKGRFYERTETIAKACKIGAASVSRAKQSLAKKGLILIIPGNKRAGLADEIQVGDLWPWNMEEFGAQRAEFFNSNRESKPAEDVLIPIGKPSNKTRVILTNNTHSEPDDSEAAKNPASRASEDAASRAGVADAKQLPLLPSPRSRKASPAGTSKRSARRRKGVAGPKVRVPDRFFPWLKRICYATDSTNYGLLTEKQHKAVAQTLSIMVENKVDLDDGLPRFEAWWKENWHSRDGSRPRPEQVRELWWEAMEATKPEERASVVAAREPDLDVSAIIRRRNKKDGPKSAD